MTSLGTHQAHILSRPPAVTAAPLAPLPARFKRRQSPCRCVPAARFGRLGSGAPRGEVPDLPSGAAAAAAGRLGNAPAPHRAREGLGSMASEEGVGADQPASHMPVPASSLYEGGAGLRSAEAVTEEDPAHAANGSTTAAEGAAPAAPASGPGDGACTTPAAAAAVVAAARELGDQAGNERQAPTSGQSEVEGGFRPSPLLQPGAPLNLHKLQRMKAPPHSPQQADGPSDPPAPAGAVMGPPAAHMGTLWGLLVLSLAYLHHSTSGFALPALLPIISEDLHLTDTQGAALTAGYTVLYALALVPVGLLADRMDRPRLLAGGIALWSVLTMAASHTQSFGQLLATRVGFAAAQATQNPVCFSLIPELFPKNRTTAMAAYNTAIYVGRALSFAALILAGQLGVPQGVIGEGLSVGYTLVPLDKVDLSLVSVLYTQGDYAAVTPVYTYALDGGEGVAIESAFSAWRQLMRWLGPPGLLMAVLALLTVEEPRRRGGGGRFMPLLTVSGDSMDGGDVVDKTVLAPGQGAGVPGVAGARGDVRGGNAKVGALPAAQSGSLVSASEAAAPASVAESLGKLHGLLASRGFLALTLAAALNDVGSWALVSWQATFYQRVYELQPSTYAPLLALVIPVGGIIGGVGAGVSGDWLSRIGARGWLTAGSSVAAAPLIALSLLVPDYKQSFAALLLGFALSECWRAPAAVMVREVSPPGLGSTASAMHLCIRNLVGGLGPIGVALLSAKVGLQTAMLLVPACYLLSGVGLAVTEGVINVEKAASHAAQQQQPPTEG